MARLTEEERKLARRIANRQRERASTRSKPFGYERDIETLQSRDFAPSLSFVITQNSFPCPECLAMVVCTETVSRTRTHRKTWRCPKCRWVMTGQYTEYVIKELPG